MRFVITTLLIVFVFSAFAQEDEYYNPEYKSLYGRTQKATSFLDFSRIDVSMQAGASVGISGSGTNYSTYLAPTIRYNLSERLRLNVGIMAVNTTFNSPGLLFAESGVVDFSGNLTRNMVFVQGEYDLTEKISINGGVYYETNRFGSEMNANQFNMGRKVFVFGADYKVGEHSSIGVQMQVSEGQSPFMPVRGRPAPYNFFW
ncbi:MAG: hypothetical protein C0594_13790 [Marinilabiliales bacterium]|nr:MAG: hypothetical protein C0594_13790 [Marinilabiliales bacterium]